MFITYFILTMVERSSELPTLILPQIKPHVSFNLKLKSHNDLPSLLFRANSQYLGYQQSDCVCTFNSHDPKKQLMGTGIAGPQVIF